MPPAPPGSSGFALLLLREPGTEESFWLKPCKEDEITGRWGCYAQRQTLSPPLSSLLRRLCVVLHWASFKDSASGGREHHFWARLCHVTEDECTDESGIIPAGFPEQLWQSWCWSFIFRQCQVEELAIHIQPYQFKHLHHFGTCPCPCRGLEIDDL